MFIGLDFEFGVVFVGILWGLDLFYSFCLEIISIFLSIYMKFEESSINLNFELIK